jgi:hypothetical protein
MIVDGDLVYSCDEGVGYFQLVTDNVRARNVLLSGFPRVVVRGDLTVANGLQGQQGEDGGVLVVRGHTRAEVIVNALYFAMVFGTQPEAVVVGVPSYPAARGGSLTGARRAVMSDTSTHLATWPWLLTQTGGFGGWT